MYAEDIKDKEWLRKSLAEYFKGKTIILFHNQTIEKKKVVMNGFYCIILFQQDFILYGAMFNILYN